MRLADAVKREKSKKKKNKKKRCRKRPQPDTAEHGDSPPAQRPVKPRNHAKERTKRPPCHGCPDPNRLCASHRLRSQFAGTPPSASHWFAVGGELILQVRAGWRSAYIDASASKSLSRDRSGSCRPQIYAAPQTIVARRFVPASLHGRGFDRWWRTRGAARPHRPRRTRVYGCETDPRKVARNPTPAEDFSGNEAVR